MRTKTLSLFIAEFNIPAGMKISSTLALPSSSPLSGITKPNPLAVILIFPITKFICFGKPNRPLRF